MDKPILAQWTEPEIKFSETVIKKYTQQMVIIGTILFIAAILLAWFLKDNNFYFFSVVVVMFTVYSIIHKRNPSQKLNVTVGDSSIQVGKNEYQIANLAGFWLKNTNEVIEINLEYKKPQLLPITFHYANSDIDEARSIFIQLLPEVAPRDTTLSDSISKFLNW